jgi:proteasome lid subunit RPN8/RPN11
VLTWSKAHRDAVVAHCVRAQPFEGCALLLGENDIVREVVPARNAAQSAKLYEVDSRDLLATSREADSRGWEILGVVHSHTHSDAYPSPTDVNQAPDPAWHYVIVSLREVPSVVRSYRITDGHVNEERVVVAV